MATPFPTPTPGARRSPTTASSCCSTPTTRSCRSRSRAATGATTGSSSSTPTACRCGPRTERRRRTRRRSPGSRASARASRSRRATRSTSGPGRWWCSAVSISSGSTEGPPGAPPERRRNPWPLSTYRVQLQPAFGFDAVTAIAPYLHRLGVSHLYASPYLQAAPGSTHGYDVIDHSRVNAELGGEAGHERMCAALGANRLGQVLDIVPNHMAITSGNRWWWDVLENGPSSQYASYFDVDWDPPEAKLRNTVLMPILGDHYGRVLEAGELRLRRDGGGFTVHYYEHVLPVAPRSLDDLLAAAARRCRSMELESLATFFGRLPPSYLTDRASVRERHRDKEVLRASLDRLLREQPEVAAAVDAEVAAVNADHDRFDALLERQNYRLAFWRTAGRELDYRRFFDIHTLAALRMEDEAVFLDTHELVISWLDRGVVDGLRLDHPDGLRDPQRYLRRLARAVSARHCGSP